MAIPNFLDDLNIISKLGDYPRSDDGLSTMQFKAKFDEAGLKIQNYINNTLLSYLNQLVDVQALLNGILDSTLTAANKAAPAKTVADKLAEKLGTVGGTLTGILNMSSNRITNVGTPTEMTDAATKGYCDAKKFKATVSVPASGWSASAPYTQTVSVEGILETDTPHWGVVYSDDTEAAKEQKEAFAVVDELDTAKGTVTFICLEDKPEVNLTIQLEVNR